jgi:hypothetical protein
VPPPPVAGPFVGWSMPSTLMVVDAVLPFAQVSLTL